MIIFFRKNEEVAPQMLDFSLLPLFERLGISGATIFVFHKKNILFWINHI